MGTDGNAKASSLEAMRGKENLVGGRAGRYLALALGREEYGLPILRVREIIGLMEIMAAPGSPRHVGGMKILLDSDRVRGGREELSSDVLVEFSPECLEESVAASLAAAA